MSLIAELKEQMKLAMRAKEKQRLSTIRMALAAIKQREVDERITVDDEGALAIIVKMVKQRRDAATQYQEANRADLADAELQEIKVLEEFMPQPLSAEEIAALIQKAVAESGASSMQDMGKVMAIIKPQVQGRADLGAISGQVRASLNA